MNSKIALRVDRLRTLRERHGWSQREMARMCNFGESQIRKYENEESDPSSTHLKRMSELLQVSTDFLLGLSDEPLSAGSNQTLAEDEEHLLHVFRDEGWAGVIRAAAGKLSG